MELHTLPQQLFQQLERACHYGDCADTLCCFRLCDHDAAFWRVCHRPFDADRCTLKVNVLPLKAQAFAPPQSCCNQHLQNAAEIKCATAKGDKEACRFLLSQRVNDFFADFWSIDLLHGVFDNHILPFCVVENHAQNVVMMADGLLCKGLASVCAVLIPQPSQIL